METEYIIKHNPNENRFEALLDNKVVGFVTFFMREDNTVVVPHTEVNSEHEGKGIAGELTKALLNYIKGQGYRVKPLCPYTKVYIDRHPEYQDLL
ncbi:GNAT family N-acetyltransferase [Dysgonomonas sp. 520]|uniref:GNAT family N-acetyltransferase n=1 Tax=Dysgonomonas sp. 520 TaxID=2302931 RepID=UPI0013D3C073|nr:GNAT family N-acetyltransferase [Dysgonomonas sp. 520]NDW10523.1 N-acetyltransferase [Dysgonomonas sp. 520]